MSKNSNELVRPSRDGDQFHYARGARLCLQLLQTGSSLKAVSIEGTSTADDIRAGDDVIDLALYEGDIDPNKASRIAYRQFKHSTRHSDRDITASGLKKTLEGFGERYTALVEKFGQMHVLERFSFEFETNRPISEAVTTALDSIAIGDRNAPQTKEEKYLRSKLASKAPDLRGFASCIRLLPNSQGYLEQRRMLDIDLQSYLPDGDKDAPLQLKELVTRKATSQFQSNPQITRHDVLESLGTHEGELFPAPNLIETVQHLVDREAVAQIAADIIGSGGTAVIQADGGVGKSVLTQLLEKHMPTGSAVFVYDCFGNGGYRSFSEYRHRAKDGLVQLANEMAAAGLCDPLIPSNKSDETAIARAFKSRVMQASSALKEAKDAVLLIVVDAADNAEMAALEANDGRSFARSLLRESWPPNVRLVVTSRPHRTHTLDPPPEALLLTLRPFTETESASNLRLRFPKAQDADAKEFHRLTSQNPRVQSAAFAAGKTLSKVLASLGPTPKTVDDTIGMLLERAVSRVRDAASNLEQKKIDAVCTALATLRPFVPMSIVAATADVDAHLVRSIANDLQRPLIVREDAVQFRDEPTETWFREKFKPSGEHLAQFAARLVPLANSSAYVAAVLPAILLEAGQFDQLVDLALKGAALPDGNPIARRDVELQRLQFAMKAALRSKRYVEAAKLTLKAGGESAADERQQELLSNNTDLATLFLEPDQLIEQVSRRLISGGRWTGSEHAYEAALLSGNLQLAGDARSKLRLANEWLRHWSRKKRSEEDETGGIEFEDIAALSLAELNLHGAQRCAAELRRWRPRNVSFNAGQLVVSRLIDVGRTAEVEELGLAAGNDLGLTLAIAVELDKVSRFPPRAMVARSINMLASKHLKLPDSNDWQHEEKRISAITAIVTAAVHWRTHPRRQLATILGRHFPKYPPRGLEGRYPYDQHKRSIFLRAYALRAGLRNQKLTLNMLANSDMQRNLRKKRSHDPDFERFQRNIGIVLPWHELLTNVLLGTIGKKQLTKAIGNALETSKRAEGYWHNEESATADEIALIWQQLLVTTRMGKQAWAKLVAWCIERKRPLYTPALNRLARMAALSGNAEQALNFAEQSHSLSSQERSEAEVDADNLITICRAVFCASEAEAREYFNQAIVVASKIGSENLSRWDAMMHLANSATENGNQVDPETAYRFARGAELTYHYVARDKHFDWDFTASSLARLSPKSAIAILSRWADRRFGRYYQLTSEAIETLCKNGELDWDIALAMTPLDAYWSLPQIFNQAVCQSPGAARCPSAPTAKRFEIFWRYARFKSQTASDWMAIAEASKLNKLDPSEALSRGERASAIEKERYSRDRQNWASLPKKKPNWNKMFKGLDLASKADVGEAFVRYKASRQQANMEGFLSQAFGRVCAGKEVQFLAALTDLEEFGLYEIRALLEKYPATWQGRLSAQKGLQDLLRAKFREHCLSISANRIYQSLPLGLASEKSGLTPPTLIAEAVKAVGNLSMPTSAQNLFRLSGLIAILLSADEASEVLRYGLDVLAELHEQDDGDGDWDDRLTPPATIEANVAGYLWAALGSPKASRRWDAAHAIRNLSYLGQHKILAELVKLARGGPVQPFVDGSFRFYDMHALQWFLIALARSALESPESIAPYVDFLSGIAQRSNRHVLMRLFASRAILALHAKQSINLSDSNLDLLRKINESTLSKIKTKPSLRARRKGHKERKWDDKRFRFGLDFPKYFLHPLATPFRMGDSEIEVEAENVIHNDWGLVDNGRWDNDERAKRKFFRDELRSRPGEMSKADDLSFYLSYHAAMTLAGKLLEKRRLCVHPEHDWKTFSDWVSDHDLALSDGNWLFDRRIATPLDCAILPKSSDEDWADSLSEDTVDAMLHKEGSRFVVAGYWSTYGGTRERRVSIASALATSSRATALVRALQNIGDPNDYRLPKFEEYEEIDHNSYKLKGWIAEVGRHDGLDKFDQWASGIETREWNVAPPYAQLVDLITGNDGKSWNAVKCNAFANSEIWSNGADDEDDRYSRGKRIVIDRALIDQIMTSTGMSLIVEVRVTHELTYGKYDSLRKDTTKNGKSTITKIYIFEPQKDPIAFRPCRQTWKPNRRRV
jgi:hypothetical protein